MKIRITYLLALLFSLCFYSCGEDDDMVMTDEALNGTWVAQSLSVDATTTTEFSGMTIESIVSVEGLNLDYTLVLSSGSFTTDGSYDIAFSVETQGNTTTSTDSYTNVSGSGSYSTSGDQITVDGQFFELEVNGMPFSDTSGPQSATYVIDGNIMTVTQSESSVTGTTSTENSSVSTWIKQ